MFTKAHYTLQQLTAPRGEMKHVILAAPVSYSVIRSVIYGRMPDIRLAHRLHDIYGIPLDDWLVPLGDSGGR